jgi:hypothetical protein
MATACAKYEEINSRTEIKPEEKKSIIQKCAAEKLAEKTPFTHQEAFLLKK